MSKITMDTDWGAKGAQLNGEQVQSFIKDELRKLQAFDLETDKALKEINQKLINIGVCSDWEETNKMNVAYIKNKPEIQTVTVQPDSNLKSYVSKDGATITYKIGDFVRFKNKYGDYVFYQLVDISADGVPVWLASGSQGTSSHEKVIIHLTTNQANNLDIANVKATVSFNESTFQIADGQHVNVPPKTIVNITFPQVEGYRKPDKISFVTVGGVSEHTAKYEAELVKVTLTASDHSNVFGKKVMVNKIVYTWNGTEIQHKIPYGTPYHITAESMSGYKDPNEESFVAGQPTRSVTMSYSKIMIGVFIQSDTGELYSYEQWNSSWNSHANGIAVMSLDHCFVMALSQESMQLNSIFDRSPGMIPSPDLQYAMLDLNGRDNTQKIIDGFNNLSIYSAAGHCRNFKFPNGKTGYLGAAGEWKMVIDNIIEIQRCLQKLGKQQLSGSFWTSTYADFSGGSAHFWTVNANSSFGKAIVSAKQSVIPFTFL